MRLKDLESWLTPGDVAAQEGISRQAVHKRLNEGRYRAVKTRAGWLVDPESVGDDASAHTGAQTRNAGGGEVGRPRK